MSAPGQYSPGDERDPIENELFFAENDPSGDLVALAWALIPHFLISDSQISLISFRILNNEMSWRLDWILLATGFISLGMTLVREGRSELLSLLDENASREGLIAVLLGGYLVPFCLLAAFLGRFAIRIFTNTWR